MHCAEGPYRNGTQTRPATGVPAVILSSALGGVRHGSLGRTTRLAKSTPHDSRAGRSAGLAPSERSGLLVPCRGRSVPPHGGVFGLEVDRSGDPSGAWTVVACPPLVGTASSALAARVRLRWGGATARSSPAVRMLRSLDSSPTLGPGRPVACASVAAGSAPSAPGHHWRRSRKGPIDCKIELLGTLR